MMGTHPHPTLSVLEGLGRWESGTSAGGIDPQRKGWAKLQDRAEETTAATRPPPPPVAGGGHPPRRPPNPPPKAPRKNPATSRVATKSPLHPQAQQPSKPKAKAKPEAKGKGKAIPPPKPQAPPCKIGAGTPMGMCRVCGTPGMSLGLRGAMGGPSAT